MATLRDGLLPVVDQLRGLPGIFGLRRFSVVLRRRVWSGQYVGDGTVTNNDLVLSPLPRVRQQFTAANLSPQALQYVLANGNIISDRHYIIDRITPYYSSTDTGTLLTGGYLSEQLRMRPAPDVRNVEPVVIMIGDDGYARECLQVSLEQDRAFGYTMLVHETDRPKVRLSSVALGPVSPTIVHGQGPLSYLQLSAVGTFEDGLTSDITSLALWSSSDPTKVSVDILGRALGVAPGSAVITGTLNGISGTLTVTVT